MKVLFCHDGPIDIDENGNAYPVFFTENVLSRYYKIAQEITLMTRTTLINPSDSHNLMSDMTRLKICSSPNLASFKNFFANRKEAKRILKIELEKADFVIARLPSRIGNMAIDLAKKTNKPYLVELVGCPWDALWNYNIVGKLNAPAMYLETKQKVKKSNYTVYVTSEFLQKRYPTEGKSTNCSNVELDEFEDQVIEKRLEKIKNMNLNGKFIIGTAAAVDVKYKGQQFVVEALAKLKDKGLKNFEYQIVGNGDQTFLKEIAYKNGVSNQVKFIGAIPHKQIFTWLDELDFYVQPSKQEGLPRALIEAMSRGIPCLGAKTAGIPELLDKEFIFENAKNVEQISNILASFDINKMLQQAQRNYDESKLYDKNIIENRRTEFFLKFKNEIIQENKK